MIVSFPGFGQPRVSKDENTYWVVLGGEAMGLNEFGLSR
jgi:hypothetical protein